MPRACPACARSNPDDSGFCQYCGTPLAATAQAQPQASAQPQAPAQPQAAQPLAPAQPQAAQPLAPAQPQAAQPLAPAQPPPPAAPGTGGAWVAGPPPPPTFAAPIAPGPVGSPPGTQASAPPAGPSRPGRLQPRTIGLAVAAVLVVAVVAGLVIPKLGGHHHVVDPARVRQVSTTPDQSPPNQSPPNQSPTTSPATSPGTAPTPTTVPAPVATTAPPAPTATTVAPGGGTAGGQQVRNSVVGVTLPSGWSINSHSDATFLLLNGPDSTTAGFQREDVTASTTLTQVVDNFVADLDKDAPDAKICSPAQSSELPGGIEGGAAVGVCLTPTAQGQAATPVEVIDFGALQPGTGGQELYFASLIFPQSISSADFKAVFGSLLPTVTWAHG